MSCKGAFRSFMTTAVPLGISYFGGPIASGFLSATQQIGTGASFKDMLISGATAYAGAAVAEELKFIAGGGGAGGGLGGGGADSGMAAARNSTLFSDVFDNLDPGTAGTLAKLVNEGNSLFHMGTPLFGGALAEAGNVAGDIASGVPGFSFLSGMGDKLLSEFSGFSPTSAIIGEYGRMTLNDALLDGSPEAQEAMIAAGLDLGTIDLLTEEARNAMSQNAFEQLVGRDEVTRPTALKVMPDNDDLLQYAEALNSGDSELLQQIHAKFGIESDVPLSNVQNASFQSPLLPPTNSVSTTGPGGVTRVYERDENDPDPLSAYDGEDGGQEEEQPQPVPLNSISPNPSDELLPEVKPWGPDAFEILKDLWYGQPQPSETLEALEGTLANPFGEGEDALEEFLRVITSGVSSANEAAGPDATREELDAIFNAEGFGQGILDTERGSRQEGFRTGINDAFTGDAFNSIDDAIIASIVDERIGPAQERISAQQTRGNLSGSGAATANQAIQDQRGGAIDRVGEIGGTVNTQNQQDVDAIRDRAHTQINDFQLGDDLFDSNSFTDERNALIGTRQGSFGDDLRTALGSEPLFDVGGAISSGGQSQGFVSGTSNNNTSNALRDTIVARERGSLGSGQQRGLRSRGRGVF
jgi:hypothetical protein